MFFVRGLNSAVKLVSLMYMYTCTFFHCACLVSRSDYDKLQQHLDGSRFSIGNEAVIVQNDSEKYRELSLYKLLSYH